MISYRGSDVKMDDHFRFVSVSCIIYLFFDNYSWNTCIMYWLCFCADCSVVISAPCRSWALYSRPNLFPGRWHRRRPEPGFSSVRFTVFDNNIECGNLWMGNLDSERKRSTCWKTLICTWKYNKKYVEGSVRRIQGKVDRTDPVLISLCSSVAQYRSSTAHAESAERPVC